MDIYAVGATVELFFTTNSAAGAAVAPSSAFEAADVLLYKGHSTTERSSQSGWTMTSPFDSKTGLHQLSIDLSDNTDAGFYADGSVYHPILSPDETVDSQAVIAVLDKFKVGTEDANVTKFGGTAGTFSGGRPEVNVSHWLGTAAATPTVAGVPEIDVTHWNGTAIPGVDTAGYPKVTVKDGTGTGEIDTASGRVQLTEAQIDQIVDEMLDEVNTSAAHNVTNSVGYQLRLISQFRRDLLIRSGTAQTGSTSNTIKLDSGASATNNIYNGAIVFLTGGTGLGQTRRIVSYNGTTKVATVDKAWVITPDNTSTFELYGNTNSVAAHEGIAQAGAAGSLTLQTTASATNNIYNNSFLTITSGTGSGQTRIITAYNGTTKVATVDSNWSVTPDNTSVYAVIPAGDATSDFPIPPSVGEIWAQAMTELTAVPGVTGTVLEALEWCFLLARNKRTQTATTELLRNNADSGTIGTATKSDDGTTFIRGKYS